MGIERRLESSRGPVLNQSAQAWLVAGGGGCTTARVPQRRLRAHASKTGAPPLFLLRKGVLKTICLHHPSPQTK